jgi:MFS family permease
VTSLFFPISALLLGTGLFVASTGLLGTILALQADALGYSSTTTGTVMAAYFVGFVVGTYFCPKVVRRAGHVRAFSAFAACAAAAVLLHPLLIGVIAWSVLRFVTGLCVVGLYMVIESWLNERSANESRGRVFAIYQVIALLSLALGQYLILFDEGSGTTPYLLAGALFSLGLVPIVLTRVKEPAPITTVRLDPKALWNASPLGVAGTLIAALANGAFFALGPVFAQNVGMSTPQIALFMSLVLLGGMALQWPIGHLSDFLDRRMVIMGVSVGGALFASLAALTTGHSALLFFAFVFLYGGATFSLYPLCVAHSNDKVAPEDFVKTAGGLLLIYGIGAAAGPPIAGLLMELIATQAFLWFLAAMQAGLTVFVAFRMRRQPAPEEREPFVMLGRTSQAALEMMPHHESPER